MVSGYQILHLLLLTFILSKFSVADYTVECSEGPTLQEIERVSGEDENEEKKSPFIEKFRVLLGLKSFNERRQKNNNLMSPSPAPSYEVEAPAPAPAPAPVPVAHNHLHPHHRKFRPRLSSTSLHHDVQQEKNKEGHRRIVIAAAVSSGVAFAIMVLGLIIFSCWKLQKSQQRSLVKISVYGTDDDCRRSKCVSSSYSKSRVNFDLGPEHFYLNTLGPVSDQDNSSSLKHSSEDVNISSKQNQMIPTFDEKSEDGKELIPSETDNVSISSVEEIGSAFEGEEQNMCQTSVNQAVAPAEPLSSDDESFHSVCDTCSSNGRHSDASDGDLSNTTESPRNYPHVSSPIPSVTPISQTPWKKTPTPPDTPDLKTPLRKNYETSPSENLSLMHSPMSNASPFTIKHRDMPSPPAFPPMSNASPFTIKHRDMPSPPAFPPPPPPPPPVNFSATKFSSHSIIKSTAVNPTIANVSSTHHGKTLGSDPKQKNELSQLQLKHLSTSTLPPSCPPMPPPPPSAKGLGNSLHPPPPPPGQMQQLIPIGKDGAPLPKLKPLHWDKVRAVPDGSMIWDKLRSSSFEFDEKMIESLFGYNKQKNDEARSKTPSPNKHILEPKRLQNITILSKALNSTPEQVCHALRKGEGLCLPQLEALVKMVPTKEEESKLCTYQGDASELDSAEKFVMAMLNVPFAFNRVEAMLFRETFEDEVIHLRKSFGMLEEACKELRSSRLFLKLLEAVLKTGNRMNVGTIRGGARAFKLDALLKLADIKGTDGKTTLLHFVVQEMIRSEGIRQAETTMKNNTLKFQKMTPGEREEEYRRLGFDLVSGLCTELCNVKKTATIDLDVIASSVSNLSEGMLKLKQLLQDDLSMEQNSLFVQSMQAFLKHVEENIKELQRDENGVLLHVKEITEYFHGQVSKDEVNPLRIFVIVRDFLGMLDQVCKEVRTMKTVHIANSIAPFR